MIDKLKLLLYKQLQKELDPYLNKELTDVCDHKWKNVATQLKRIDERTQSGFHSIVDKRCTRCGKWTTEEKTEVVAKSKFLIELWDQHQRFKQKWKELENAKDTKTD